MFPTTNVKAGEILLKEQPFVYVLSGKYRTEHCDHCFAKGQLLKCSGCQYVHYCGKGCQRESWSIHKMECDKLKRIIPRIVPDAIRLIAKIIHKINKGGEGVRSYYTRDRFRTFKDLMSHYSDLKLDHRRLEHFTTLCAILFEFIQDTSLPNSAELIGIYGRMVINSFNICDSELKSIGVGVYLGASVIDHSCKPNAVATFEGTTLFIRTLVDLKVVDWTKVFISYIDVLNTPQDRCNELERQYYFLCRCTKCIEDKTNLNFMYGAACQRKSCDGCIDMYNYKEGFTCNKCHTVPEQSFVDEYKEVTDYSKDCIDKMKNVAYYDLCKVCLKRQDKILHKLNTLHIKVLDLTFESSIDFCHWEEAKELGTELLDGYLFYYDDLNPLLGLLYMKLAKICALLNEDLTAIDFLRKAFNILKITHGIQSKLFRNEIKPLMEQLSYGMTFNN
ncbi:uncharacterized protein [Onthophagus taurus]|uniref:uncharacterized protein isoform X2 n=1 Tax=Onthophagus taurus TaxID=166361 RepID=UPI000C2058E8|nr:histone-lysine N-methyltransferase ASHR1 isoform X2 [Onthophagus taurus]